MKRVAVSFVALLAACESGGTDEQHPADAAAPADAAQVQDATAAPDAEADAGVEADAGMVPEVDTPITDRFRAIADSFDQERRGFGAPGAALLILENGEVTFAHGFGTKDPTGGDPVLSTTLFRMGSVNKMLTTAALLGLVADNQVQLDDPITTSLPDFVFQDLMSDAQSIHIRHLLTHSSGIVDYTPIDVPADQHEDAALDSYLTGTFDMIGYQMDPAGSMWNYSNPNFYLAGLILERVGGVGYRQAMKDRVFTPLGMDRTFFLASEVLADGDYANATSTDEMGQPYTVHPDSYENAWARPAGFAFSSVRDLAKFVLFLEDGNTAVLPDALRMEMESPQVDMKTYFDQQHYGYALFVYDGAYFGQNDFRQLTLITHGGAIPGYSAEIWYVPSLRFGFVTLASTDGAYFADTLVLALQTLTTLPASTPGPQFTPNPADYGRYAGLYNDTHNAGRVEITANTSSLSVSMPDLDRARVPYNRELVPIGPDNFILTVQGYQVAATFILDSNNNGEYFRTRPFVARRTTRANLVAPSRFDRERFLSVVRDEARRSKLLIPR